MDGMFNFFKCKKFPDISKWNVSNVSKKEGMFFNSNIIPYPYITNWDISHIITIILCELPEFRQQIQFRIY